MTLFLSPSLPFRHLSPKGEKSVLAWYCFFVSLLYTPCLRRSFGKAVDAFYTPPKTEKPPSTQIIAPVTNFDASLNNQTKAPFNSSGLPKRLKGV